MARSFGGRDPPGVGWSAWWVQEGCKSKDSVRVGLRPRKRGVPPGGPPGGTPGQHREFICQEHLRFCRQLRQRVGYFARCFLRAPSFVRTQDCEAFYLEAPARIVGHGTTDFEAAKHSWQKPFGMEGGGNKIFFTPARKFFSPPRNVCFETEVIDRPVPDSFCKLSRLPADDVGGCKQMEPF
jgi:hypothetical protein